jgi:hypothetical protein
MKKLYVTLSAGLFLAGIVQAATLADIDAAAATVDYTGEDFSEQSVETAADNWGRSDNFTNADFSSAEFTFTGNQPFLATTITNADFSGATFNITTWANTSVMRFNAFRNATGTGADFSDSVWNFTLSTTNEFETIEFFNYGAGATDLASKEDAFDFSGAVFTFDISASNEASQTALVAAIITNLGSTGTTEETAFGAIADAAFLTNNYAAFGYADADALGTALTSAGWQVIPEPGSYALLAGLLGMSYVMVRRRRGA